MKKPFKIFLVTVCGVLVVLLGLVVYSTWFVSTTPKFDKPIGEIVSANILGWTSKDLPLAETETMMAQVNNILQFDQYIYRLYEHDNTQVTVYVAYWGPGKVTTADAGTHNPDSCWVNAGWTREERKYGVERTLGGKKLKPLEYGVYGREKMKLPVIFWHLVGDEVNRYQDQKEGWRNGLEGRIERIPLIWADLKKYGLNQRREQMFIRITANKSFETLFQDPDFIRLMEALAPLGIFVDQPTTSPSP
jgi:hypothetical protein